MRKAVRNIAEYEISEDLRDSPLLYNHCYDDLGRQCPLCAGATMSLGSAFVAVDSTAQNRGIANSSYNAAQGAGNMLKVFTSSVAETAGLTIVFIIAGITTLVAMIPITLRKERH